jgi:predicted nucleic acid-binding Zn ribbon protein
VTGFEDRPVPLGDALERLLGSLDAPPVDLLATVFQRWEEVVGPDVARHCRPAAIEGERLIVLAADATWASEVQWLASAVLARINEMSTAGRLESLTVRVRPVSKD